MENKTFKKADFSEYYDIDDKISGEDIYPRALVKVKGEDSYCVVHKVARGVYEVLVRDAVGVTNPTYGNSVIVKKTDGSFDVIYANAVVAKNIQASNIQDGGLIDKEGYEVFIITDKDSGLKYYSHIDTTDESSQAQVQYVSRGFEDARPFTHIWSKELANIVPFAVVTDPLLTQANMYMIDGSFKKVSDNFKEISKPNKQGFFTVTNKYGLTMIMGLDDDNEFITPGNIVDVFLRDENGGLLPPTQFTPIKSQSGSVLFVDATKFYRFSGAGKYTFENLSDYPYAERLSAPDENGVVEVTYKVGRKPHTVQVALLDKWNGKKVISRQNIVEDPKFYGAVFEILERTNGDALLQLDRKYFKDKSTLNDIFVAHRKFIQSISRKISQNFVGASRELDLSESQKAEIETVLNDTVSSLLDRLDACVLAKRKRSITSVDGKKLEDLTVDEILENLENSQNSNSSEDENVD